jgi:hypothetical protein
MNEEQTKHFQNIVDSIACADGGIRLVYFKAFVEEMASRKDDEFAPQIIEIMRQFSRLIDAAQPER